jgi:hypothetical protein
LTISLDSMFRISSNPFFPYLLARIDEAIAESLHAHSTQSSRARRANSAPAVPSLEPDPEFDEMQRRALDMEQDPENIP